MDYSFTYIDESRRREWENLLQRSPAASFMQTFEWAQYYHSCGCNTYKIGVVNSHDVLIAGSVIVKHPFSLNINYLYMPGGPIISPEVHEPEKIFDALIGEVIKLADTKSELKTSHLRVDPLIPIFPKLKKHIFINSRWLFEPSVTRIVDVSPHEEVILQRMTLKGRYNVNFALKRGVRVYEDTSPRGVEVFLKLYNNTVQRKKYNGRDESYFDILIPFLKDFHRGIILIAEHEGTPLAAALYIFYNNRCTYFQAGTGDEKRNLKGSYALMWEAMRFAKARGCTSFDLYGLAHDENDITSPWYGFSHFKKEFGGERIEYCGAHDHILNSSLYHQYLVESGE